MSDRHNVRCTCGEKAKKLLTLPEVGRGYLKDAAGNPIWFPDHPYYDKCLARGFRSAKEKQEFMKEKGIIMDGSDDPKNWPDGDMKDRSHRKSLEKEGLR